MKNTLLVIALLMPGTIIGGGFQINTQGTKAMGFGGYATAMSLDATAVYFNPGAISHINQHSITAGFSAIIPTTSYLDPYDGNTDMKTSISVPFHFYGIYKLKKKFTAGLSINTPFSNNTKWDDEWVGRYITQESRLRTLYLQPTIAYEINNHLSAGAGVVAGWAQTKLRKAMDYSSSTTTFGESEYKNKGIGFGFNAGIYFIYNKFSAGISYRSGIKFKLDNGTVTYTDIPNGANILETIPAETSYKSDINMPGAFDAGMTWKTTEKISLTVNFSLSQWLSNDSVNYAFSEQPTLYYSEAVNYKNSAAVSFGGQYQYNERTLLRAGLAYEKTPVPDGYVRPSLPDANKWSFCGGISYTWKMGLTFDAAIMFQDYKTRIEGNNRQDNFNGQYKTNLYIIGLGLDYAF